jgi:CD2 antigen cytoplasmic tail-binding protein 2
MSKKVKFASVEEEAEFQEEFDVKIAEEDNDLDLDTIRARSKSRTVKNIDEADEDDDADDDEADVKWDSFSESEEEKGIESQFTKEEDDEDDDKVIPLEPFTLRPDREEGSFDAEGFFIRAIDQDAGQDRWLSNLTKSDISKARLAHQKVETERKAAQIEREGQAKRISTREAYEELLELMRPGQSVLMAIRSKNLVASTAPRPPLNKNRLKKLLAASLPDASTTPTSPTDNVELNRLTELADLLMNRGNYDVYEESFEEIFEKINNCKP